MLGQCAQPGKHLVALQYGKRKRKNSSLDAHTMRIYQTTIKGEESGARNIATRKDSRPLFSPLTLRVIQNSF